jgi:hypothetical protein
VFRASVVAQQRAHALFFVVHNLIALNLGLAVFLFRDLINDVLIVARRILPGKSIPFPSADSLGKIGRSHGVGAP